MNIYDMMKQGMNQEEIFNAFKQECVNARETIAKEEAAAAQKEKDTAKESLLSEGRVHLINAILAYSEAYGYKSGYSEQEIEELEKMIKDNESEMEVMFQMAKSLSSLFDTLGGKSKGKKAADLGKGNMNDTFRRFFNGLM